MIAVLLAAVLQEGGVALVFFPALMPDLPTRVPSHLKQTAFAVVQTAKAV